MGRSRVSGPWAGAYNTLNFYASYAGGAASGVEHERIWTWTVPAGMNLMLVDAQFYSDVVTGTARVNLLCGGASVLSNTVNSGTTAGVGLSPNASAVATLSNGVFGTASTSIIAPTTPSLPFDFVMPTFGAYVAAGATLAATIFQTAGAAGTNVTGTILFYPVSHPSITKTAFE